MVGREIAGRYRIKALLGTGGMGAVYRAEQLSLKRTVALKLLKDELCEEPGIVRRFNAEAELAAKLNHPNTVTLFDFGQESDGTLFIAMEFVQGRSLRGVIKQGPVSANRAVHICEQVCASLADAHRLGIIHRDLKPDNVMLSERGKQIDVVTVLDFGIAKLRDRDDGEVGPVTQAGDLLGTPQYMAPEQIRGEAVDGRTDVYALGVMLYEMLTGRVPFTGKTVMSILSKQLTNVPPRPSEANQSLDLHPDLEALVMASLEKDPAARPESMDAVGDKLADLASQLPDAPATRKQRMSPSMMVGPTLAPSTSPSELSAGQAQPQVPIRPPGVPLTPDSFPHLMPQPPTAAVEQLTPPPATASPGPVIAGPAPGTLASPAAPSGRSATGWIVGGMVLVGVAIGGIMFALQGKSDGASEPSAAVTKNATDDKKSDDKKSDDKPNPVKKPVVPPSKVDLSTLSGVTHTSNLGWKIRIPLGYTIRTNDASGMFIAGIHQGENAAILIAVVPEQKDWTKKAVEELVHKSAAGASAVSSLKIEWMTIQGTSRLAGAYVTPEGQQYAFVVFVHGKRAYMVAYTTMEHVFKTAEPVIKELVEKRFQLP